LQAIPAIRSAFIPLADDGRDSRWSKPFSLIKADFEPWLSFYAGYCDSRLFLAGSSVETALVPDYPVQALFSLRALDARLLHEPLVQIDAPVEYFDASRAPRAGRVAARSESLARAADAMHRSQLRRAVERGRDMGNALHEALLGNGLSNLIGAWEKRHGRKPNPHELHLMLTTGRAEPVKQAPPVVEAQAPARPAPPATRPAAAAASAYQETATSTEGDAPAARSKWWYLFHAAGLVAAGAMLYILAAA
ncbi:MAG TPA: hypothetical protein VM406_16400, partial [Noviherbaspirillum sp.]|nr:hypothetical protein [Noviherbaspirillum sp.]